MKLTLKKIKQDQKENPERFHAIIALCASEVRE